MDPALYSLIEFVAMLTVATIVYIFVAGAWLLLVAFMQPKVGYPWVVPIWALVIFSLPALTYWAEFWGTLSPPTRARVTWYLERFIDIPEPENHLQTE